MQCSVNEGVMNANRHLNLAPCTAIYTYVFGPQGPPGRKVAVLSQTPIDAAATSLVTSTGDEMRLTAS